MELLFFSAAVAESNRCPAGASRHPQELAAADDVAGAVSTWRNVAVDEGTEAGRNGSRARGLETQPNPPRASTNWSTSNRRPQDSS